MVFEKMTGSNPIQPSLSPSYQRGDIWMVDFGQPVGAELGMEHPALIVSIPELVALKKLIVVAGTSTRFANRHGNVISFHLQVPASASNGLDHTTYFMSEQVRSLSVLRFRRRVGSIESKLLQEMEDKLCLVMKLFR